MQVECEVARKKRTQLYSRLVTRHCIFNKERYYKIELLFTYEYNNAFKVLEFVRLYDSSPPTIL